jgi:hypothetical protein
MCIIQFKYIVTFEYKILEICDGWLLQFSLIHLSYIINITCSGKLKFVSKPSEISKGICGRPIYSAWLQVWHL